MPVRHCVLIWGQKNIVTLNARLVLSLTLELAGNSNQDSRSQSADGTSAGSLHCHKHRQSPLIPTYLTRSFRGQQVTVLFVCFREKDKKGRSSTT